MPARPPGAGQQQCQQSSDPCPHPRRPAKATGTAGPGQLSRALPASVVGRSVVAYIAGMLSADEIERYARHIVLREVGGPGQAALGRARVLVVGAGGLGAPALLYLAAARGGTLGIVDDDVVALSNLQRQVIHATPDIGTPKVDSAAATIRRLNPHVAAEQHH